MSRHMKTSSLPSPFRSPTKIGPSEPQAPVHLRMENPAPVDRLIAQDLSMPRHMNTSCLPSPCKSPVKIGPSEPQAPVQEFIVNPFGLSRLTTACDWLPIASSFAGSSGSSTQPEATNNAKTTQRFQTWCM